MLADVVITAALLVAGYVIGTRGYIDVRKFGGQPQFYQQSYDAAVMEACGRGFHAVSYWDVLPPLKAFLERQTDTFDCADLPANWPAIEPSLLQRASRYLLAAAALDWRLRGISWSNLLPLFGVFYALAAAAAYWTLRLGMRPLVAVPLVYAFLTSPLQLANLPHLRDYAKTPFVIALVAFTGWMLRRAHTRASLIAISAAAGVAMGLGVGVRTDLLLLAVAAPIAVLCARTADHQKRWRVRAEAAGAYLLAFFALAFPVLQAYASGNNIAHVIVLGYMTPFNEPLVVADSYYNFGSLYNDSYVTVVLNSYAERQDPKTPFAALDSAQYAQIGGAYLRDLVRVVPADFLVRGLAAVRGVLDLPFVDRDASAWTGTQTRAAGWIRAVLGHFSGAGYLLAIAALVAIGTSAPRLAWWLAMLGLYLGASTALQFQERHYFHLEILGLVAAGAFADAVATMTSGAIRRRTPRPMLRPFVLAGVSAIGGLAVLMAALVAVRVHQQRAVHRMVENVLSARAQLLGAGDVQPDGSILIPVVPQGTGRIQTAYLMASIAPSCRYESVPITLKYAATVPYVDFHETVNVPMPQAPARATRVFIPAYTDRFGATGRGNFAFKGLAVPQAQAGCIEFVARVDGPPPGLLPFLVLQPDWKSQPAYQRLGNGGAPRIYSAPEDVAVLRGAKAVLDPFAQRPDYIARIARRSGAAWSIDGQAEGRFTYLLQSRRFTAGQGWVLRLEGTVDQGGLTIGVQSKDQWIERVNVTSPGSYRADLQLPAGAELSIVVANCLPNALRNSATIDRAVVLDAGQ
jgi:hypothetical protein